MQITLNSHQSQILETLSQQGGYTSLEDAIDTALILLAYEIKPKNVEETSEYLAWVEQTRLKIEEGLQAAKQGDFLEVTDVLDRLRDKVEQARTNSV